MPNLLHNMVSRKSKFWARYGIRHAIAALLVGGVLAAWLVLWQGHADGERTQALQQDAAGQTTIPTPLPPHTGKIGGAFSLTSQDGKTVTEHDFPGSYLLVYFGYTSCPDMCPTGLQSMSRTLDLLKDKAGKVQPLFITVDPARDTPKRLREYDSAFHPQIIGLTGTEAQIAAAASAYQVYYRKGEGDQDYEVEHTSLIYLMNPKGDLVTTFDEEVDPKLIVAALQKEWDKAPTVAKP